MNLVRWNPFRDFYLENQFNRLFEGPSNGDVLTTPPANGWFPLADVYESDKEFVVKVELPGVDPKDVDVRIEQNHLTVRGERRSENSHDKDDYHRIERHFGAFSRTLALPLSVDADKTHAGFKAGVLEITLPKAEDSKSRKVEVKAPA